MPLKTFLQKQAKQFQQSSIAQTYVAVIGDKTIIGFVTLTCSEIDLQNGYDLADCSLTITRFYRLSKLHD